MTCFRMKDGQTAHSYCKSIGLCYQRVWQRVDSDGVDIETAIELSLKQRGKKPHALQINGSSSMFEACLRNMSIYNKAQRLIRNGMSHEQAVRKAKEWLAKKTLRKK